jgi:hypothetical protein
LPTVFPALPTLFPADFAFSSTLSRTASTGFAPEPFLPEPEDRLPFAGLEPDPLADREPDLLPDLLLDLAAGRAFFVELALVDPDLRDELGRADAERLFV